MKNEIDQLFKHATTLHQQGDFKGAQSYYHQIIKTAKHPEALHLCGLTFAQQGQFQEAIRYISEAIRINPNISTYHTNLGEAYGRMGDLQQALIAYETSIKLDPKSVQAYFGKANVLKKMGDLVEAKQLYQKTVEINPQYAQGYYNWGNTERDLGNYSSALKCYEKCLAINDKHSLAHNNLGIVLQHWKRNDEAIAHYKKALTIDPNYKDAHSNLAKIYESQGDLDRSKKYYKNMLSFSPDDVLLHFILKTLNPIVFESNAAIDQYHQEINAAIDQVNVLPFTPNKLSDASYNIFSDSIYHGRNLRAIKEKYAQKFVGNMPKIPIRKTNDKLHIGFVVTNGHEGVFTKCMSGILNQLDKKRFDVSVICSFPNGKRIIKPTLNEGVKVNFIEIPERFDQAVQIISNAKIDVLNYWEIGTDTTNYFLPFLRLAPVQCTSWGWPITSGIPTVDYFISSKHLEIPEADEHYSEKLIRMDRIPVYYYAPPVQEQLNPLNEYGLSSANNLYLCAQNLKKVHPDFDELVLGILKKDPKALVLFIEDKEPNITNLLQARLKQTCKDIYNRVKFLPKMEEKSYLSLLKQVDVALDTLHYGGGANTCYDAFVCGTPVITLPGEFHRSRYAYAAYQQMGIEDCIATSTENYISKAVYFATNPEQRSIFSQNIKEKSTLVLKDQAAVNELSDLFEELPNKTNY